MRSGNMRLDPNVIANLVYDPSAKHVELALVYKPANGSHFTLYSINNDDIINDVYIECKLVPMGELITARLCPSAGTGSGFGVYSIPPVDTEVIIVFPGGSTDNVPYLIANGHTISQSGDSKGHGVPDELDETTLVITNKDKVIISNSNGDITINAKSGKVVINASDDVEINGNDKQVAYKDGAVDGGTLIFVPGASGATLNYVPAGGTIPPGPALAINGGKITDGSSKVKIGI